MRIKNCNNDNSDFADNILSIGNGTWKENEENEIEFNQSICNHTTSMSELICSVFPNIESNYTNAEWLAELAIITLRNESVDYINEQISEKIPGEMIHYKSIDTTIDENEATIYPTEFLNSLHHSGIPQHHLKLKVNALIILMRNLNPPTLCNGTKLIVKRLNKYTIQSRDHYRARYL